MQENDAGRARVHNDTCPDRLADIDATGLEPEQYRAALVAALREFFRTPDGVALLRQAIGSEKDASAPSDTRPDRDPLADALERHGLVPKGGA